MKRQTLYELIKVDCTNDYKKLLISAKEITRQLFDIDDKPLIARINNLIINTWNHKDTTLRNKLHILIIQMKLDANLSNKQN